MTSDERAPDEQAVRENIERIRERISRACQGAGRSADEVTLMAVSKTRSREEALAAYRAGIRVFGENRVQEAEQKFAGFDDDFPGAELHLIGHLQSNKAKNAAGMFSWVQSIDKVKTARALQEKMEQLDPGTRKMKILLEVNTSGEESKFGYLSEEGLFRDIEEIAGMERLDIRGVMTVGPLTEDEKRIREAFSGLRSLRERCAARFPGLNFDVLSMGMSGDFDIAVREGSTLVRVGTSIFGPRRYT